MGETRENQLALWVHEATLCRQRISSLKDGLQSQLWAENPRKHKKLYDEYEPMIRETAYRLSDVEKRIEKFRPKPSNPQSEREQND